MDEEHREILRLKRRPLAHDIQMPGICKLLCDLRLISHRHVDKILVMPTNADQVEALLDLLPDLGPYAFDGFCDALKETGQGHIVHLYLKPDEHPSSCPSVGVTTVTGMAGATLDVHVTLINIEPYENNNDVVVLKRDIEKELMENFLLEMRKMRERSYRSDIHRQHRSRKGFRTIITEVRRLGDIYTVCKNGKSIIFCLLASSSESLEQLWGKYISGQLGRLFRENLITEELKRWFRLKELGLKLDVHEEQYLHCHEHLYIRISSDLRKEDFIQEYKEEVQKLKMELEGEKNGADVPADLMAVLTRDAHNIDFKPFVSKSYLEDPNEQEFSDSSLWLFDQTHLREWLHDWQPFDMKIGGEAAWDTLPTGIIARDEPTTEQTSLIACRQSRTDFWDHQRMRKKRQRLANYFIRKYNYYSERLEKCLQFATLLEENAKKLEEFATDPFRADYKETLLKLKSEFCKSQYSDVLKDFDLAVVTERNMRKIEDRMNQNPTNRDANEVDFPAVSFWMFSPGNLCDWRTAWQPFDMKIDGETAWRTLPTGVVARDEPTAEQVLLTESRHSNKNWNLEMMACRRKKLIQYFIDKYKLKAETLESYYAFCDRHKENEDKLQEIIK